MILIFVCTYHCFVPRFSSKFHYWFPAPGVQLAGFYLAWREVPCRASTVAN